MKIEANTVAIEKTNIKVAGEARTGTTVAELGSELNTRAMKPETVVIFKRKFATMKKAMAVTVAEFETELKQKQKSENERKKVNNDRRCNKWNISCRTAEKFEGRSKENRNSDGNKE